MVTFRKRTLPLSSRTARQKRLWNAMVVLGYLLFGLLVRLWWKSLSPVSQFSHDINILPQEECSSLQTYRSPKHHEGLPRLIEVFHTDDSVYFAAMNDGVCEPEWRGAQSFPSTHSFLCKYSDGTEVPSDPVPPTQNDVWTTAILMIRCDLPPHTHLSDLSSPSPLTVSLYGTVDLEAGREKNEGELEWKFPSSSQLGAYRDLQICPREWTSKHQEEPRTDNSKLKVLV